jgi:hypothetical protein
MYLKPVYPQTCVIIPVHRRSRTHKPRKLMAYSLDILDIRCSLLPKGRLLLKYYHQILEGNVYNRINVHLVGIAYSASSTSRRSLHIRTKASESLFSAERSPAMKTNCFDEIWSSGRPSSGWFIDAPVDVEMQARCRESGQWSLWPDRSENHQTPHACLIIHKPAVEVLRLLSLIF